ncbi:MAG: hypothetical protein LBD84_05985 [Campylobacteraceae bacterium]|nr:hypothetical protein [Campylobacteraceae bacterium]
MQTGATFTPPTDTIGTTYYYVVITNTNNNVNGTKTASITSNTARIIINASTATYSASFYDENLDLLVSFDGLISGHEVDIASNKTAYGIADWYLANSGSPVTSYNIAAQNINFYATANVWGDNQSRRIGVYQYG